MLLLPVQHLVQHVVKRLNMANGYQLVPNPDYVDEETTPDEPKWNLLWNSTGGDPCAFVDLAFSADCCCPNACSLCKNCLIRVTFFGIQNCVPQASNAGVNCTTLNGESFILAWDGTLFRQGGLFDSATATMRCDQVPTPDQSILQATRLGYGGMQNICFKSSWSALVRCCQVDNVQEVQDDCYLSGIVGFDGYAIVEGWGHEDDL